MANNKTFNPSEESGGRSHWKTIKTLAGYLWPADKGDLRLRVIFAFTSLTLAKVISVYIPFLYKRAIDSLTLGTPVSPESVTSAPPVLENLAITLPLGVILAYGLARILSQAFDELRDFFFIRVAQYAKRTIALNTFKHLHDLSLSFHLDRQTGGLSRVIERGNTGIQSILGFTIFNILPTLIEIIMVTGVLFYKFDIRFAGVTFFTILGYIAYTLIITEWRLKFRREMNERDSEANTKSIDSLLNYETVKYFGNEDHEYRRFDESLAGYEKAAVKDQSSLSMLNIGQGTIISTGLITVMIMAGGGVVEGRLTIGDFVLVNTFLIQLYLPLNFLGFLYRLIKQSLIDMDKMFELLEVPTEINDSPGAKGLTVTRGEVEFRDVTFGYNDEREILKDVNFSIESGKTVAIVGPSGAGKSTISRLLFRFYDAGAGAIRIDGEDIREVTQHSLRGSIGIVPQDTVLFNDTIGYNIRYGGVGEVRDEDVVGAARLASIHDFIMGLPDGYNTVVGERGLKLSGGEKQRVAIARAILKDPPILLFDEATSALDSRTEKEIQASLREISRDRTTLVIAHRLSTVIDADQIIVLKGGEIAERGTHSELLAMKGEYTSMWYHQQEQKVIEEKLTEIIEEEKGGL